MRRHEISDADWGRVENLLPSRGPKADNRTFVNAVLYVAKTGVPWRDLPDRFGNWNSVWRRFARWAKAGGWGRGVAGGRAPPWSPLSLAPPVARPPPPAAGPQKKTAPRRPAGAGAG